MSSFDDSDVTPLTPIICDQSDDISSDEYLSASTNEGFEYGDAEEGFSENPAYTSSWIEFSSTDWSDMLNAGNTSTNPTHNIMGFERTPIERVGSNSSCTAETTAPRNVADQTGVSLQANPVTRSSSIQFPRVISGILKGGGYVKFDSSPAEDEITYTNYFPCENSNAVSVESADNLKSNSVATSEMPVNLNGKYSVTSVVYTNNNLNNTLAGESVVPGIKRDENLSAKSLVSINGNLNDAFLPSIIVSPHKNLVEHLTTTSSTTESEDADRTVIGPINCRAYYVYNENSSGELQMFDF